MNKYIVTAMFGSQSDLQLCKGVVIFAHTAREARELFSQQYDGEVIACSPARVWL